MTEIPTCDKCTTHGLPKHIETTLNEDYPDAPEDATHCKIYVCTGCRKFFRVWMKREHIKTETGTKDPFREW